MAQYLKILTIFAIGCVFSGAKKLDEEMSSVHHVMFRKRMEVKRQIANVEANQAELQPLVYRCEGALAKVSHSDCEVTANPRVCYYVDVFYQYKSCAADCNDILEGSRDEERCESIDVCSRYLRDNCLLEPENKVTEPPKTRETNVSVALICGISVPVTLMILGVILALICYKRCRTQRIPNELLLEVEGPDKKGPTHPEEDCNMPPGPHTVDQKPIPATDTNDGEHGRYLPPLE